jgi:predicted metal-dependent phosphoesterase TrpH
MSKIDHHVHTTRHSPDSDITPTQLIASARNAGLDAIVITEHDALWDPKELADLNRQAGDLVVLAGVEVSALEGHFLVYGLTDLARAPVGVRLVDLMAEVERQGAAIVAAHPYRWAQDFDAVVRDSGAQFDAVELVSNNVTRETRALTQAFVAAHRIAATGSSDGHQPHVVGCYYTEFPDPVRSMADFVAALKAGRGRPRHRPGAPQACGPAD